MTRRDFRYVQLDDGFPDHPKIVALSHPAFRAIVEAVCYCHRHQTDGFVPTERAERFGSVDELVDAGLYDRVERRGFWVHDYLDWNESREEADARRTAARTAAGMRWASRSQNGPQSPEQSPEQYGSDAALALALAVEVQDQNRPSEATTDVGKSTNPLGIDEHQQGLLMRLWERRPEWVEGQGSLTHAGLVRLMKDYGAGAVNAALEELVANERDVDNPFTWLRAAAREHATIAREREGGDE